MAKIGFLDQKPKFGAQMNSGKNGAGRVDGWKSMALQDPVLESMRAREPGLQAPSNLAGSKIKNTHIFPLDYLGKGSFFL